MRVLFITNSSTERCGVRVYGELWMEALRGAGVEIDEWDGTYEHARRYGYLPTGVEAWDLVHLNWDPQTINHYLPEHFAGAPPLSVFLHDVPPNSTCPVAGVAKLVMAHEPGEGISVIDHAVPDYRGMLYLPAPGGLPVIGLTGIRRDAGVEQARELCKRRGWVFSEPPWWNGGPWLSTKEEIARLSACDVNVNWYHATGRGKSMSAMMGVAARRPLVLSPSTMFSALWGYRDEITFGGDLSDAELEDCIDEALSCIRIPKNARVEQSWAVRAEQIKALWEGALR